MKFELLSDLKPVKMRSCKTENLPGEMGALSRLGSYS